MELQHFIAQIGQRALQSYADARSVQKKCVEKLSFKPLWIAWNIFQRKVILNTLKSEKTYKSVTQEEISITSLERNLRLKLHDLYRKWLSSHPSQSFDCTFSIQGSALAESVSSYSKTVSFVAASRWPSFWMLRQRTQKIHKWRMTKYAFCSILTTQIPDMAECTLMLPTLWLQVCINIHTDSTVWMLLNYGLYTEKPKIKSHTEGAGQGRALFTLKAVQVFPAPTKQNLTEANYTACVLEA